MKKTAPAELESDDNGDGDDENNENEESAIQLTATHKLRLAFAIVDCAKIGKLRLKDVLKTMPDTLDQSDW